MRPDDAPNTSSVAARAAQAAAGGLCVVLGIASLPLPLFPSLVFVLIGAALIARSSLRMRRWLFAQPWFVAALGKITNARAQRLIARVLGEA
jgi:uncharacterized membrane protein YbaN (DUF454 family)